MELRLGLGVQSRFECAQKVRMNGMSPSQDLVQRWSGRFSTSLSSYIVLNDVQDHLLGL